MKILPTLKSEAIYARDIVKAGLDAATSAGKTPAGERAPSLARVSQSALAPAALGPAGDQLVGLIFPGVVLAVLM